MGQAVPSRPTLRMIDLSGSSTAWLKTRRMSSLGLSQLQPVAGVAESSLGRGVSKDQLYPSLRLEPSTPLSPGGTVTVNRVAKGSGERGTNSTLAEPIHRHSPSTAGLIVAGGASAFCSSTDISATTGREKVMVGRASAPTTSCGRAATTVSPVVGSASAGMASAGGGGSGWSAWPVSDGLPLQAGNAATASAAAQTRRVDATLTVGLLPRSAARGVPRAYSAP